MPSLSRWGAGGARLLGKESNSIMKLYLKNTPVYDIDNNNLLDKQRAPGILQKHPSNETFSNWLHSRYSSNTNAFARISLSREVLDKETHIFNLSDCYWIADDNTISFENASPYLNNHKDYTIPTFYTNGYLTKRWISSTQLLKCGTNIEIEIECSRLTRLCHIPCAKVTHYAKNAIVIENFTSKDVMFEAADVSGRFNPDNFNEADILHLFHLKGFHMILTDAIFGNGDRHAGNFGYLRDANTGEYLSMAPLYDFDHALDAKGTTDNLLLDAINISKSNKQYKEEAIRISTIIANNTSNEVFRKRASCILKQLKE